MVLTCFDLNGQGLQCRSYPATSTILLDTIPVEPGSITIENASYDFDPSSNRVTLSGSIKSDSITICFRTVSTELYQPFINRSIDTYDQGRVSQMPSASTVSVIPKEEIFQFNNMDSYGAISRGVTFGNRQNVFVNSALNLQLDGQLSENLFVSASITDQNVPFQPEGNTQQIRDFDNVYIKLYNDQLALNAGDVVLTNPVDEGYFLQYYKNVQGLSASYQYDVGSRWKGKTSMSGSAAKGQFYSAQLTPLEGIQGPYRLTGPNGERYIIVMADSERVFVDGKLLERGFDRDYVIDYNLGEITFSNSILITRYTRIRVDFEYAEQYYGRSNFTATQEIYNGRTKFFFNFYQEKDNPNTTLGYTPSPNDINTLSQLGDNDGLGIISGADETGYIEDAVLYFERDTLIGGITYTYFEYTTDPDIALFRVSFSEVELGNGDYQLVSGTANGRVYRWVAPVSGVSQGNYAPVRTTPLPNSKRMLVVGNATKVSEFEKFTQELAISDRDENLYSLIDDGDNQGIAWRGSFQSSGRKLGDYGFDAGVSFESLSSNFKWIDRFRPIEYDRNWGYDIFQDSLDRSDHILKANIGLTRNTLNQLNYHYSYRDRNGIVNGHQHDLEVSKELGPLLSQSSFYYLNNDTDHFQSKWMRAKQDIRLISWGIQPGYRYEIDQQRTSVGDSLTNTLMHYYLHDFYLRSGDSSKTSFRLDYIKRYDQQPLEGRMRRYTSADQFVVGFYAHFFQSQRVGITGNYRKVTDHFANSRDKNILGRLDWQGSFFKKLVQQQFSYSTANTRELRREFVFILVPTGQGTHTWRDENDDGEQDLNEFYEAINYDEKNYAKIFLPTDEYINAFQSTFQHSIDARLPKRWESGNELAKILSRVTLSTNVRLNYKSVEDRLGSRLNPINFKIRLQEVLSAQAQQRYTLFYNRNGSGLAMDISHTQQDHKTLLTNGFELRSREDWIGNFRYSINQVFTVRFQSGVGETTNQSDYLASRNFQLHREIWAPELIWQPTNNARFSAKVALRSKAEKGSENQQHSDIQDYLLESTWIRSGKGNFNIQLQWLSIGFDGEENTYLAYELLEGLQPGQNKKWNLNWQQSLGGGLQLTFQYNGRKSPGLRPIHTGTMQLTAFF